MLKYIIIIIFIFFSCSENNNLEKTNLGSNKNIEMVVGYPCNNSCVWSSYAVNMNIQEGKYNCVSGIQLAHAGRKASFLRPWDGASPIRGDD